MPPSQNASFIPKQSGKKIERNNAPRKVFIGTIIIRVIFFVVLIIAVVLFIYDRRLNAEIASETLAISTLAKQFDADQMQSILAFDERLKHVNRIMDNSFSTYSLIDMVANNTLASVQIRNLEISRGENNSYLVIATMDTDIYDSVIVQRDTFSTNSLISASQVSEVKRDAVTTEPEAGDTEDILPVSFEAEIKVDRKSFPITSNVGSLGSLPPVNQPEFTVTPAVNDQPDNF